MRKRQLVRWWYAKENSQGSFGVHYRWYVGTNNPCPNVPNICISPYIHTYTHSLTALWVTVNAKLVVNNTLQKVHSPESPWLNNEPLQVQTWIQIYCYNTSSAIQELTSCEPIQIICVCTGKVFE